MWGEWRTYANQVACRALEKPHLKTQWGWREKDRDDDMTPDEFARAAFAAAQAMCATMPGPPDPPGSGDMSK